MAGPAALSGFVRLRKSEADGQRPVLLAQGPLRVLRRDLPRITADFRWDYRTASDRRQRASLSRGEAFGRRADLRAFGNVNRVDAVEHTIELMMAAAMALPVSLWWLNRLE